MIKECPFCGDPSEILSNELAFVRYDKFPVNPGHVLIVPRRHVSNYFELELREQNAIWSLLNEIKRLVDTEQKPNGYNVGINIGEAAGQTVWHAHIHLIPRFVGDVSNPRGGVRGVIPSKRDY